MKTTQLSVRGFGLACGIFWSVSMLFLGLWIMYGGHGSDCFEFMSKFYIGYSATWFGSIIGAVWGFFDALICGAIFAWLYNKLS